MSEQRRLLCTLNPKHTTPTNPRRGSLGRGKLPVRTDRLLDLSSSEDDTNDTTVIDISTEETVVANQNPEPRINNPNPNLIPNRVMAFTSMDILKMLPEFRGQQDQLEPFLLVGDIINRSFVPPNIAPVDFIDIVKSKIHADCKGAITGLDTWPAIKTELQASTLPVQSVTELVQLMATSKQSANQSARDYGIRMEQILTDLLAATRATVEEAAHAHFETSYRAQALSNFIFGLRDPLRAWVKGEKPPTLRAAREIATRDEPLLMPPVARQQPHSNNRNQPGSQPNAQKNPQGAQGPLECYKCKRKGHTGDQCRVRINYQPRTGQQPVGQSVTCYKCNQRGHFANSCPQRGQPSPPAIKNEPNHIMTVKCSYCKAGDHTIHQCELRKQKNQGLPSCGYCALNYHTEEFCNKKIADRRNGNQARINLITSSKNEEGIPSANSPTSSGSQKPQYGPGPSSC